MDFCKQCHAIQPKFRCSQCKSVAYCSRTCQSLDWSKSHGLKNNPIGSNSECFNARELLEASILLEPSSLSSRMVKVYCIESSYCHRMSSTTLTLSEWKICPIPAMLDVRLVCSVFTINQHQNPPLPKVGPAARSIGMILMIDPISGLPPPFYK